MQLYSVVHFFYTLLDPKASEKKWATGQSCIQKWSTTYKIETLIFQPTTAHFVNDYCALLLFKVHTSCRQNILHEKFGHSKVLPNMNE